MIKLSTKGRYAVRAMLDLAQHTGAAPVCRADIARRQCISADYIAQLFLDLQRSGLVRGVKGPGGGYALERAPSEISIGDIVRAAEGSIALVECVEEGHDPSCPRAQGCATRQVWHRASQAISESMDGITLQDLCDQAGESEGNDHGQNL